MLRGGCATAASPSRSPSPRRGVRRTTSRPGYLSTRDAIAQSTWAFWGNIQPDGLEWWQQQDAYAVLGHFDRDVALSGPAEPRSNLLIRARNWLLALISPLL